jgi:hypothetical protein
VGLKEFLESKKGKESNAMNFYGTGDFQRTFGDSS